MPGSCFAKTPIEDSCSAPLRSWRAHSCCPGKGRGFASTAAACWALRHLGSARTAAYFSLAPFIGAVIAIVLLSEPVTAQLIVAGALTAFGLWLHLTERHEHDHTHEAIEHEHRHVHDQPHQHVREGTATEPHTHWHRHDGLRHRHAHYPDLHHRHEHD